MISQKSQYSSLNADARLIITLDYRDQGNVWMSHLKLLLIWGENLQVNACNTALHQFQWLSESDKGNSVIVGVLIWNAP